MARVIPLLTLDPGSSTGYSLTRLEVNEEGYYSNADIYEYGYIDVDTSSDFQGDWCIDLMNRIQAMITDHSVEHIAIEDYFFSKRFCNGSNVNAAFRTAIHILARQNNIEYTILNISQWKTFVAGRPAPTKEQKRKWGAIPAKKLYIQQALWEYHGFKFPNHSISETTGKPIVFRCDIIDVVAQTVYYCGLICQIRDIRMSVEVPEDVVWKKKPKKLFEYPA
jgi:Holliday junction resolvasome RuvABC endonuclease subunit